MEELSGSQASCAKDYRIDQVNNVGIKLIQAAYKKWSKEVKL
jgi:hypothetical protein